jgi:hypothetical protein
MAIEVALKDPTCTPKYGQLGLNLYCISAIRRGRMNYNQSCTDEKCILKSQNYK